MGLGALFVFTSFGIVAVTGTYFVQAEGLEWEAFAFAVPVGLMATAILIVNNVRDMDTDRRAGKRTLAVRLGRERTRTFYVLTVGGAYLVAVIMAIVWSPWVLLPLLSIPLALAVVRLVREHTDGPTLNEALGRTGMLQLVFCVLLAAGILLA